MNQYPQQPHSQQYDQPQSAYPQPPMHAQPMGPQYPQQPMPGYAQQGYAQQPMQQPYYQQSQQQYYQQQYYQQAPQPIFINNQIVNQVAPQPTLGIVVRLLYFLFFGIYIGFAWIGVALFFCMTIIGLPLGIWMFNRTSKAFLLW